MTVMARRRAGHPVCAALTIHSRADARVDWVARTRLRPRRATTIFFRRGQLSLPAVRGDARFGQPDAVWQFAGLPEHIDGNAAARVPVAGNAEEFWLDRPDDALADCKRAILVKRGMIAEARQKQFQRFGFDQCFHRAIVDDEMREIGLAGDRTKRGECWRGNADDIVRIRMWIGDARELRVIRRLR